ncbi:MAG: hypothetical protein Q8941_18860 [Bacteroidota bacterium]|nr:hypothetical protein [Bacteroidota bacterium]
MKAIWMNTISGWNFIKIIRVLTGVFILFSGIDDNNTPVILLGAGFLLFSLTTRGVCCALYSPPRQQNVSADLKDIDYEELGSK